MVMLACVPVADIILTGQKVCMKGDTRLTKGGIFYRHLTTFRPTHIHVLTPTRKYIHSKHHLTFNTSYKNSRNLGSETASKAKSSGS